MPLVTPEHEFIRRSVREFVEAEVKPIANDLDRANQEIPERILKQMAELGYFGVIFPAEEGGMGLDYISMAIVTEELSRGWLSVGSVMTRNIITGTLISANGTPEQKKKFLPPIARGEILTAAAFTEPDSGSDTASFKTRAVKDGDGYLIKGSKMWCTFANRAHMLTVMTRTDPDMSKKHKGLSLILFEKQPGDDFMPPHADRIADSDHWLPRDAQLRAAVRRRVRAEGEPDWRRGRARLLPVDGELRGGANPDGGARRRRRAGGVRMRGQVREGSQAVRPADRRFSGDQA